MAKNKMRSLSSDTIELRAPSRPEYISIIRALITDIAQRMALSKTEIEDLQVSISEACTNVVCHAYPDDTEYQEILVRCSSSDTQVILEVIDTGNGFRKSSLRSGRASRRNGYGLILIRQLMDEVSLDTSDDRGTLIRMVKNICLMKPSAYHDDHQAETVLF
ncbi:MAG: ATP-binding protein [Armatimonadota bacterium]